MPFSGEGFDVFATLQPLPPGVSISPDSAGPGKNPVVTRCETGYLIRYADGATFALSHDGGTVEGHWSSGQTLEHAVCYLVGPILRMVLRLRGVLALHGSGVGLDDDRAIVVVGPSGAGKSTTAAALVRSGATLLTDDTVTLSSEGRDFRVHPGYCGVRLWPDVATALCADEHLHRIAPSSDKRFLPITGRDFRRDAAALRAIYVLRPRDGTRNDHVIEPLRGHEAFVALIANTGVNYLDGPTFLREDFRTLTQVLDRVPVRGVTPRDDLGAATSLAAAILEDAQSILRPEGV